MKIFKISYTETEFENGSPIHQEGEYGKEYEQHDEIQYVEAESSQKAIEQFMNEYNLNVIDTTDLKLIKRTASQLIYSEIDSDKILIYTDFKAIPINDLYELEEVYNGSDEFIYKTNYDEYYIVSDEYSDEEQYVYKWDYTKAPDKSIFSTENRGLWNHDWCCKCSMTNRYLQACTGDRDYSDEEWEVIIKEQDEELRQSINLYENEEYRN